MNLLSARDGGQRRILPADEFASMPHHGNAEAGLTVREAERCERSIALRGKAICNRQV